MSLTMQNDQDCQNKVTQIYFSTVYGLATLGTTIATPRSSKVGQFVLGSLTTGIYLSSELPVENDSCTNCTKGITINDSDYYNGIIDKRVICLENLIKEEMISKIFFFGVVPLLIGLISYAVYRQTKKIWHSYYVMILYPFFIAILKMFDFKIYEKVPIYILAFYSLFLGLSGLYNQLYKRNK